MAKEFTMMQSFGARKVLAAFGFAALLSVSACTSMEQVQRHGYQLNEESLALVPEGSSREQVRLSLGTPSTTQIAENGTETFYYISQTKSRPVAFMQSKVVDQRVLAVYFSEGDTVQQIANYGLQDGKVFDFVGRVTPTGGKELTFLSQLLGAATSVANPLTRGGS